MADTVELEVIEYPIYQESQQGGARGWWSAIRVDGGYIQAKYEYQAEWTNLVALSDLIGPQGVIFTPHIGADGVLTWTNDGGLDNPTPVDLTGPQGDPAPNTTWQYSTDGTTWTTDATGAVYERQSGDNGVTWSEAIRIPHIVVQYKTGSAGTWHDSPAVPGDNYRRYSYDGGDTFDGEECIAMFYLTREV